MRYLIAIAWIATGTFIGSFGALFLKIGAGRLTNFKSLFSNWRLVMGVSLYLLSSIFYLIGVGKGDLSALFPMVSIGNIWTLMWSKLILHESITGTKIVAVGIILAGCVVLALGSAATPTTP